MAELFLARNQYDHNTHGPPTLMLKARVEIAHIHPLDPSFIGFCSLKVLLTWSVKAAFPSSVLGFIGEIEMQRGC